MAQKNSSANKAGGSSVTVVRRASGPAARLRHRLAKRRAMGTALNINWTALLLPALFCGGVGLACLIFLHDGTQWFADLAKPAFFPGRTALVAGGWVCITCAGASFGAALSKKCTLYLTFQFIAQGVMLVLTVLFLYVLKSLFAACAAALIMGVQGAVMAVSLRKSAPGAFWFFMPYFAGLSYMFLCIYLLFMLN